jgi:hypothetical protein
VKNKGLSTTQDGISQCNTGHNLYEVRSLPRKNPENQNVSKQRQIEQQVLLSLQQSKKTQKIRRFFHHIAFILFAPPYFILYRFPRWIFITKVRPLLIRIGNRVKRVIAICNKIAARLSRFFQKLRSFIMKVKQTVRTFYLQLQKLKTHIVNPILFPFRAITKVIKRTRSKVANLRSGTRKFFSATYHKYAMKVKSLSPFNLIPSALKDFPESLKKAIRAFYDRINIFRDKSKVKNPYEEYYFPVEEEAKSRFPVLDRAKSHFQKEVRERAVAVNNRIDPFRTFGKSFKKNAAYANVAFFSFLEAALSEANNYLKVKAQAANKVVNRKLEPYVIICEAKMQIITGHCTAAKNKVLGKYRATSKKVKERILVPIQKRIEPYWKMTLLPFTLVKKESQKVGQGLSRKYYSVEMKITKFRDRIIDPFRLPVAYMRIVPKYSLDMFKEAFAEVKEKQLRSQDSGQKRSQEPEFRSQESLRA